MAQQGERKKKLRGGFFAAWGRLMYRRRIIVLCCSAVLLVLSLAAVIRGGTLVGVITADFESQRAPHRALRTLFDALNAQGFGLDTLSIGMSGDLEAAVAEGATWVRIGAAIFGARAPKEGSTAP